MLKGDIEKLPPEVRQWLMENTTCSIVFFYDLDSNPFSIVNIDNELHRKALLHDLYTTLYNSQRST